jgi:hypothetical protein
MDKTLEQGGPTNDAPRARRKRLWRSVAGVVGLLGVVFWLLLFVAAVRAGYLSWIGITVGTIFVASLIISPILSWVGAQRLALVSLVVHLGIIVLYFVAAVMSMLWPEGSGSWHAYRFDEDLAAIEAKRAVPDAENAAPRYELVFAMMDAEDDPNSLSTEGSLLNGLGKRPWKRDEYPQVSVWLDSHSHAVDVLLRIGQMEKCRWPVQADWFDEYTVPYDKLRHSVRLLTVAATRDLGEGRVDAALAKCFCLLRIGDHLHQQPSTMDALVGFACEEVSLPMIRNLLVQGDLSNGTIAGIADHLPPTIDPWPQQRATLIALEKLQYMNGMGHLYEVNAKGDIRFTTNPVFSPKDRQRSRETKGGKKIPRMYWLLNMPRDPRGIRAMADEYVLRRGPLAAAEHLSQTKRDDPLSLGPPDFVKVMCNFYRWSFEASLTLGDVVYTSYHRLHAQSIARRRGTWLVLGLRWYRDAHGVWPQTLDPISEYVPAEAFLDPTAGGAFVYVPDGESFRLYSKGPNGIDEGGRDRYVKALDKVEDDIWIWPPPPSVRETEPPNDEELRKQMEEIYGREYVEKFFKDKDTGSDKE